MNLSVIHAKKLTGSPLRGSESSEIILRRAPQTWMLLVVGENKRPNGDRIFQHFVCWPCPFVSWKDFILKDGDFHMLNQRFLFILF